MTDQVNTAITVVFYLCCHNDRWNPAGTPSTFSIMSCFNKCSISSSTFSRRWNGVRLCFSATGLTDWSMCSSTLTFFSFPIPLNKFGWDAKIVVSVTLLVISINPSSVAVVQLNNVPLSPLTTWNSWHCMLRFVSTITAQRPITVSGFPPPYGISCIGSRLFSFGFPICEYVFSSRMFTEAPVSIVSQHSTSSSLATVNGVFVFLPWTP